MIAKGKKRSVQNFMSTTVSQILCYNKCSYKTNYLHKNNTFITKARQAYKLLLAKSVLLIDKHTYNFIYTGVKTCFMDWFIFSVLQVFINIYSNKLSANWKTNCP